MEGQKLAEEMSDKLAMELFTTTTTKTTIKEEIQKIKVDKYTFDHIEDYKNFAKVN